MKIKSIFEQSSINLWICTILIFGINLIVKLWDLSIQPMYGDEPFTLFYSQQSLEEIITRLKRDSNPFLHPFIVHYFIKIFGITVYNAKLVSVIFSSLAGALLFYMFGKRKMYEVGFFVAIIFLLSGMHLFYSQEIRGYAQLTFFTTLSIHYFLRVTENPKVKHIFILGTINLALVLTHYTTFILPLIQSAFALTYIKSKPKTLYFFVLSQLFAALVFLPWLLNVAVNNVPTAGKAWIPVPSWRSTLHAMYALGTKSLFWGSILSFAVVCASFFSKKILNENFSYRHFLFFTASFWLSAVISYIISQKHPIMLSKYLLFSSIGLFISVPYLISHLKINLWFRLSLFVILLIFLIRQFSVPKIDQDWPGRTELVRRSKLPDAKVIVHEWWWHKCVSYYWNREYFMDYKSVLHLLNGEGVKFMDYNATRGYLQSEKPPTLILMLSNEGFYKNYESVLMQSGYTLEWSEVSPRPCVYKFSRSDLN